MSRSWIALGALVALVVGCEQLAPAPAATSERDPPRACVVDDDCVLLPASFTCCGDCPPAPPFEAAPSTVLAGMEIERETTCAEPRHLCVAPTCDPVPATCAARAICSAGRCEVAASDCGR